MIPSDLIKPAHLFGKEPGVFRGVPFASYLALSAASASGLKILASKSPKHYRHEQLFPKQTKALDEGRAMHTFVLEPDRFWNEYALSQQCCAAFKSGKRKGEQCPNAGKFVDGSGNWYCGTHEDGLQECENLVTPDLHERLKLMYQSVWEHPEASAILRPEGRETELSCVWTDPATGALCKMRTDIYRHGDMEISDLKKCTDASEASFNSDAYYYGYADQAAWYLRGANACFGKGIRLFKFIAIEDDAGQEHGGPHCVNVFTPDAKMLQLGEARTQSALDIYAQCMKTGIWPGYAGIHLLTCSQRQVDKEIEKAA